MTSHGRLPAKLSLTKFTSPSEAFTNPLNVKGIVPPCITAVQFPPSQKERGLFSAQQHIPSQGRGNLAHCMGVLGSDSSCADASFPFQAG